MQKTNNKTNNSAPKKNSTSDVDFYSPNIPKSFQLGGFKIDVRFKKQFAKEGQMIGVAHYVAQEIILDPTFTVRTIVEQTYLHELVHWILFVMGEEELRCNEKFVDIFSHFLYQAMTTAQSSTEYGD